jgi:hypothetical protein
LTTPTQKGSEKERLISLQIFDLSTEERVSLNCILPSSGFGFTAAIQRSWCEGRAANAAALTLSILPLMQRRQVVEEWVNIGGGTSSFFASEADSFLEFIARRLPDRSHELAVARMEQAVLRANNAAAAFRPADSIVCDSTSIQLRRSKNSELVYFYAEPQRIFAALEGGEPLPPLSDRSYPVLFAPGLPGLFRSASCDEAALWDKLAAPMTIRELFSGNGARQVVETFVAIGAVERNELP